MNDFTKDELEEILMWADFWSGFNPELIKKIQSMIDNYCEHTNTKFDFFGCTELCSECNKVVS